MVYKSILSAILFLFLLIISSCKDQAVSPDVQEGKRLVKISSSNYAQSFSYESGRIVKGELISKPHYEKTLFVYSPQGNLDHTIVSTAPDYTYKVYYYYGFGNRVVLHRKYNENDSLLSYYVYSYDIQNRVIKVEQFVNKQKGYSELYTYDNRGNVSELQVHLNGILQNTVSYEYDDNINPLQFIKMPYPDVSAISKNNLTKFQVHFAGNIPWDIQFNYTYDDRGYPLTRTEIRTGEVETYEYE